MARAKPWLKMWVDWLHDPFMVGLSNAETGCWWKLYALAHSCQAEGQLVSPAGTPLSKQSILDTLHIVNPTEVRIFNGMVDKMIQEHRLHWDGDTLVVTNYVEDQEKIPSGTPEAVADRVKKYRERHAPAPSKEKEKSDRSPTPPPKNVNTNTTEGECNADVTAENPLHTAEESGTEQKPIASDCNGKAVTNCAKPARNLRETCAKPAQTVTEKPLQGDPVLVEICKLYVENIGELPHNGVLLEDIVEFSGSFKGDVAWIKLAFLEALKRNKHRWQYIRTILERWQDEGGPDGAAGQELERTGARPARPGAGANREHSQQPGVKHDWKVKGGRLEGTGDHNR